MSTRLLKKWSTSQQYFDRVFSLLALAFETSFGFGVWGAACPYSCVDELALDTCSTAVQLGVTTVTTTLLGQGLA